MKKRVKFCLQPTRNFPDGAPDRGEYSSDADHLDAVEVYCREWLKAYECTAPRGHSDDCPQHQAPNAIAKERLRLEMGAMQDLINDAREAARRRGVVFPSAKDAAPEALARQHEIAAELRALDATARPAETAPQSMIDGEGRIRVVVHAGEPITFEAKWIERAGFQPGQVVYLIGADRLTEIQRPRRARRRTTPGARR